MCISHLTMCALGGNRSARRGALAPARCSAACALSIAVGLVVQTGRVWQAARPGRLPAGLQEGPPALPQQRPGPEQSGAAADARPCAAGCSAPLPRFAQPAACPRCVPVSATEWPVPFLVQHGANNGEGQDMHACELARVGASICVCRWYVIKHACVRVFATM